MRRLPLILAASVVVSAGCGAASVTTTSSGSPAVESVPVTLLGDPLFVTDLDGAVAVSLASNGDIDPTVAWITTEGVLAAGMDPTTGDLHEVVDVSRDVIPIAHPIERPAVAVHSDGTVDLAFTSFQDDGAASVFYSADGSNPQPISGVPQHETNLVHMTLVDDSPVLSWLEDSTLSVAVGSGDVLIEHERVDDLTCDCCNPVPIAVAESLVVAFRDFAMADGQIVRNVAAVQSRDGRGSFAPTVAIADDDWFISGCPFSGPAVLAIDGELIVTWMDGRQSAHPDQTSTSIWIDRSTDGGASFGTDLEVTGEGINRWPVLAASEDGVIYLVWETSGMQGGLSYATSVDGGSTFAIHGLLLARAPGDNGAPKSPSVIIHDGYLIVTWADSSSGHVASWELNG